MKKLFNVLGVLAIIVLLSSCNRGYGCPSDFSIQDLFSLIQGIF